MVRKQSVLFKPTDSERHVSVGANSNDFQILKTKQNGRIWITFCQLKSNNFRVSFGDIEQPERSDKYFDNYEKANKYYDEIC